MKHFLLKFNHGVEIGAYLAYLGHADRTLDHNIYKITRDELRHRHTLSEMLKELGEEPNPIIDGVFTVVGSTIRWLCKFFPIRSLTFVARSMELFAIFSYSKLALRYPRWKEDFEYMAWNEKTHEAYFRTGSLVEYL